jgi:hypothetical protein
MVRQAMFGLGIAVAVGVLGQAAALYVAGQASEPGLRAPQTAGQAAAARRLEAFFGADRAEPARATP